MCAIEREEYARAIGLYARVIALHSHQITLFLFRRITYSELQLLMLSGANQTLSIYIYMYFHAKRRFIDFVSVQTIFNWSWFSIIKRETWEMSANNISKSATKLCLSVFSVRYLLKLDQLSPLIDDNRSGLEASFKMCKIWVNVFNHVPDTKDVARSERNATISGVIGFFFQVSQ